MHTVIEADKKKIDQTKVLSDAINNNISSFTPDFSYQQMVKDYKTSEKLLGKTMIRELTGYDPGYVGRNINIPEFQRELKRRIEKNIERLKKSKLLEEDGSISEEGFQYSALAMLSEDLDKLSSQGFYGQHKNNKANKIGEEKYVRQYKKGDKYKDINSRASIRQALRRGNKHVKAQDLQTSIKQAQGTLNTVYAIDTSGSMKGEKIKLAKQAGLSLAYMASKNNDKTGLITFNSKIGSMLQPTTDFSQILHEIAHIKTRGETDITKCLEQVKELFTTRQNNHLVLITDAVQTLGEPEQELMKQAGELASNKVSLTIIGISLNEKGETIAKKIIDITRGKLYKVNSFDNLSQIVLEDYYSAKEK